MDLRDLVTAEASDFAERLTAALNAQVDEATRRAQEEAEAALHKIRAELQQARAALDKARAESEQARGAAEKSRAETEQFRGALSKSRSNEKTLAAAVEKLRGDQSTLQAAIDKYRMDEKARQETITRLQSSEKSLQATVSKLQAAERSLQTALDKLRSEQSALQSDLDKARADEKGRQSTIERLQASEKSLQASLDKLQGSEKSTQTTISKLQASEKVYQAKLAQASAASALAEAELKKVQAERDDIAEELQRAEASLAEQSRQPKAQPAAKDAATVPIDLLRNAFQKLTSAGTVSEVLTVLVDALSSEFSRVALFHVNGNRLEGRRQTGFDFGSDISKVAVPLTKGSALAEAVRSGRVQGLTAAELTDGNRKLFGGSPSFVLILPVSVVNEIHAVIYADNSDQPKAEVAATKRGVHFAEILLWHAIPLIGRLAAEEQALGELREYSTQLLSDLENVYNGDVAAGHKGEKLQRRLQHNIEYARNMFGQRAQDEGLDSAELFDVQLARMITAKQSVPFGRDLAAAARASNSGDQKAEAS
jgi:chemotaxis protein histidine kinase CheA